MWDGVKSARAASADSLLVLVQAGARDEDVCRWVDVVGLMTGDQAEGLTGRVPVCFRLRLYVGPFLFSSVGVVSELTG